jgi:hypothetical protein
LNWKIGTETETERCENKRGRREEGGVVFIAYMISLML